LKRIEIDSKAAVFDVEMSRVGWSGACCDISSAIPNIAINDHHAKSLPISRFK
jgi:hypothetical protein